MTTGGCEGEKVWWENSSEVMDPSTPLQLMRGRAKQMCWLETLCVVSSCLHPVPVYHCDLWLLCSQSASHPCVSL